VSSGLLGSPSISQRASEVFRPGISLGGYPERDEPREPFFDRLLRSFRGALARRNQNHPGQLRGFVRCVEERAAGLADAPDAALTGRVAELRERLALEGLTDEHVACCFALVRELARRRLGTPHYDVQLMGGWVMARGMLAEMETGEGKTLTATLPACAAALAGIPVHVISSNDYLVKRDAEAMRPLYAALGLSVGAVTEADKDAASRRAAYACDVTYGTAKVIAFDYLRDRLERGARRDPLALRLEGLHRQRTRAAGLLLRGVCFAIVDEADSVLVDEARTPLILSRPGDSAEQRRSYRSALRLAKSLEAGADFQLDRRAGTLTLSESGRRRLAELAQPLGGFWTGPRRREEWALRALQALHLFARDHHYLVRDGKVQLIDQPTGRVSPDRSWERGLHQLIETKEGCEITPELETLARISYQQFFRRYLRLAGTTGTAREVARELWSVYRLNTIAVPTRLPVRRRRLGVRVVRTQQAKWQAVVSRVRACHDEGQPVLVGTCSVAASEHLSALLADQGLHHQLLNARHDADEANIVARAGERGRITVATNMAGRGTDIGLAAGVAQLGGLHVIATQRSGARRIDRQLFGRCGRQGDPGSYEAILSLEDEPVGLHFPRGLLRLIPSRAPEAPIWRWGGEALTSLPQLAEESRHRRVRRSLVELEEYLGDLLAFAGPGE
jgi:preprotein translocase subunit SecA